jgi:hypothetical protein
MNSDKNQIADLPLSLEEIRAKLTLATEKWRETGMMLCDLRRDVAHCLVLKMTFEKVLERSRKRREPLSPASERRLEKIPTAARALPSAELRRIFVRVNHLVNLPLVKDQMTASALLLPSLDAQPCQTCGLTLPMGRKKFCSDECRKHGAKRSRHPGAATEPEPPEIACQQEPEGEPSPESGFGHRNLECRFYDACLDLAILEEWEGFHCVACELKGPQEQLALGNGLL